MDFNDADLVAAINRGDESAFNSMVRYFHPILVKSARIFRGLPRHEAEDVAQNIFLRIWKNRETWYTTDIEKYLLACVRNESINFYRTETQDAKIEEQISTAAELETIFESADQEALQQEFINVFNQAVDSLSDRDKAIYILATEENLTPKEIGPRLKISANVARRSLQATRNYLATQLSELGWPEILQKLEAGSRHKWSEYLQDENGRYEWEVGYNRSGLSHLPGNTRP